MLAFDPFALALAALLVDAVTGDPPALYRRVPHPVAVVGKGIAALDARLNDEALSDAHRVVRGGAARAARDRRRRRRRRRSFTRLRPTVPAPAGALVEAAAASILIAYRGLRDHVGEVARGLESGLADARAAVSHLVGRDPASLDGPGVARAGIESLAENFADGVVAPLFWYVLLGFPGLLAYKAINTLDSMIGHRDPVTGGSAGWRPGRTTRRTGSRPGSPPRSSRAPPSPCPARARAAPFAPPSGMRAATAR